MKWLADTVIGGRRRQAVFWFSLPIANGQLLLNYLKFKLQLLAAENVA